MFRLSSPALAVLVLASGSAWAQVIPTLPDAGQRILREQEKFDSFLLPAPTRSTPLRLIQEENLATPADGPTSVVLVQRFRVTGATKFSTDELLALLNEWLGRELTLGQLRQAAARITQHYRAHGYLVSRAYLPAQQIGDGTVEIAVLEGKVGKILLNNTSWVSDERIRGFLDSIDTNDPLSESELDLKLRLVNELPGVGSAVAALQPGDSVGLSDINVVAQPSPFITGSINADSNGSRYTGIYNLGVTTTLHSPLHLGDELMVMAQHNDTIENRTNGWGYKVPVGSRGLVLALGGTNGHYRIGQEFAHIQANGEMNLRTIGGAYPLVRTAAVKLDTRFSLEHKTLRDRMEAFSIVSNTLVQSRKLGLSGQIAGTSGAFYTFNATYTSGDLDLQTADNRNADALSARTQGGFDKVNYSLSASLPLTNSWASYFELNGQVAGKNLNSAERFSLGGANGVRAYPVGEASGDEGYVAKAELRYALPLALWLPEFPGQIRLASFVDHGAIKINHTPFSQVENTRSISALGVGVNWETPGNFLIQASVARRLGSGTPTSDPQSGMVRAWLQGVKYF
jgi:hemolysin activation/secretion protein